MKMNISPANILKRTMAILFIAVSLIAASSSTVYAVRDICDEAYLRDIGATTISCYDDSECSDGTGISSIPGDDNVAKIFNYFLAKGYKDFQIAGMLGNMKAESGIAPQVLQGKGGKVTTAEDVPPGTQLGYGLVQWTPASKMINPVKAAGKNPNDLGAQLDFLWDQLEGRTASPEKKAGDHLKATTDVASATLSFETKYERHAGRPQPNRITDAETILNEARAKGLASGTGTSAGTTQTPSTPPATEQPAGTTAPAPTAKISSVYILGDSITVGAKPKYDALFTPKGITPTYSAVTSRSWNGAGSPSAGAVGTTGAAKTAIQTDSAKVKAAGAIVIALGSNGGIGSNPPDEVLSSVKAINSTAPIYWVNIAGPSPAVAPNVVPLNTKLSDLQKAGTLTVVDWAKEVDPTGNGTKDSAALLDSGGVHPNQNGYTKLTAAVERAVSSGVGAIGQGGCAATAGTSNAGFAGKVVEYAWPDYHRRPYITKKPEYEAAVKAAQAQGRYVGGNKYPGVDCGGFVTTLMIDSGFDPTYNSSGKGGATAIQKAWLDKNWQSLGAVKSTADLRPGDVAMQPGHTFVFVGAITGFNSEMASASLDERAPMADKYGMDSPGVVWYRKK